MRELMKIVTQPKKYWIRMKYADSKALDLGFFWHQVIFLILNVKIVVPFFVI